MQINICDENISNTQVNKKIDEKKETTSTEQEKPKEPDSKPKNNVKKNMEIYSDKINQKFW